MAKDRKTKALLGKNLAEKFNKAPAAIVAEYRGSTAEEMADLRRQLRKVDSEFRVLKNRAVKKAISEYAVSAEALSSTLRGPIGITYLYGDPAAGTKTLLEFAKDHANMKVTAGLMDGALVSAEQLKAISELPSKEVLLGRLVGTLVAPHRGLLYALNGVSANLVRVIQAIKDKKPQ
jgi:large subunit ribosomal protein L10